MKNEELRSANSRRALLNSQFSILNSAALLGRDELPTDLDAARRALAGRRVLVTGAGGSVGTNLAELLHSLEPEHLVLLDHHDHALFTLKRRLEQMASAGSPTNPATTWRLVLADVRDTVKLSRLLDEARPDVIFHLAAYKHVPFGEQFPEETFAVNVVATARLLDLASARGVERFVYPSSDKAVNPPSLYGATKRLCEILVQRAAHDDRRGFAVARFVNILGTHGSAIEIFAEQINSDQPLTVMDPSMARYWISMREATWLLVQSGALARPGAVLMLDAGDEVPVVAMVRRVEALLAPGTPQRQIHFTGTRPGERLREELLSEYESFKPGPCPGIFQVWNRRREEHVATLADHLGRLEQLADTGDAARLKAATMEAARALQ
ncbi:MAG TPA: polysaccharide biosynthesis protein [Chloroflexota bacterium]|nr:polysaccharide biosynthesis protein [Chloroflexota bacterium]